MGTPIDRSPAGVPCVNCWGSSKTFGDVFTPKYVTVAVTGIEKGTRWIPADGNPPNGVYDLAQDLSLPCKFANYDNGYVIELFYWPAYSAFQIITPNSSIAFIKVSAICKVSFHSRLYLPGESFVDGIAKITLGFE